MPAVQYHVYLVIFRRAYLVRRREITSDKGGETKKKLGSLSPMTTTKN